MRGERGEIVDDRVVYLQDYGTPIHVTFTRHSAGVDGNLEGNYLKGIQAGGQWWYRNPLIPANSLTTRLPSPLCCCAMAEYVDGERDVSLAEACQDRYLDAVQALALENQ